MNSFFTADPKEELCDARQDLAQIVDDCVAVHARQTRSWATRFNEWDNQSEDGRKHADDGALALPFEGASDARIPLVDTIVNDKVALSTQAFWRAEVQSTPIKPGDTAQAASVSTLLRWLRRVPMREQYTQQSVNPTVGRLGTDGRVGADLTDADRTAQGGPQCFPLVVLGGGDGVPVAR